jgi:hypothetical protein
MQRNKSIKIVLLFTVLTLLIILVSVRFNGVFGSLTDWISQHVIFPDYFRQLFYKTGIFYPILHLI